jgi:hypothetical protein
MPILATNIQKARHPMPPVTVALLVDGEERTETLRFSRCTRSPATRAQFQETFEKTAPEKEEIIRILVVCDVQSLDIVDPEGKPFPLDAEYLDGVDDMLLSAIWNSLQESLRPNEKTSTSTNSG